MMVLITYDINTETPAGQKRLRKVAQVCQDYGQRVQHSVFECVIDAAQLTQLKHRLTGLIDVEKDSVRFYQLGDKCVFVKRKGNHLITEKGTIFDVGPAP